MRSLKSNGPVSRQQFCEVRAEAAHLASRAVNSVRSAWEEDAIIHSPDKLVEWTKTNVAELYNMTYLGSVKHPQIAYRRARIGGVTPGDLEQARNEFEMVYGMEHNSIAARAAYEVLMTGVQFNMRWQPEQSVVPALRKHYRMDGASRVYALGAQRADIQLLGAALDLDL